MDASRERIRKITYIIISSLIACIFLYWVEQVLMVDYSVKTLVKMVLFTLIPYLYMRFFKKTALKESFNYKIMEIGHLKKGFFLGGISFLIIFIAYYVLKDAIDFQEIANELQSKSKITPVNFALVGLYIIFGNSFLEEFFFRGFIFLSLYELNLKKSAHIYSSLLFGLYHIAIFKTWFNIELIGLALIGLISIGFIFNWLDAKLKNFMNSWIVHILADIAIVLIGLKMFGMI